VDSEELEDGICTFKIRGELDMGTVPDLERKLEPTLEDPAAAIMLDLSECEFIDSTGVALIVRTWQQLERGSGRLAICSDNLQVRRLLKITGVEASIPMHEQRDAALADLRG
jgi:anti-anti-sigma factor